MNLNRRSSIRLPGGPLEVPLHRNQISSLSIRSDLNTTNVKKITTGDASTVRESMVQNWINATAQPLPEAQSPIAQQIGAIEIQYEDKLQPESNTAESHSYNQLQNLIAEESLIPVECFQASSKGRYSMCKADDPALEVAEVSDDVAFRDHHFMEKESVTSLIESASRTVAPTIGKAESVISTKTGVTKLGGKSLLSGVTRTSKGSRGSSSKKGPKVNFGTITQIMKWRTRVKTKQGMGSWKIFATDDEHLATIAKHNENIIEEIPLPMRNHIKLQVHPILVQTAKHYKKQLGHDHPLTIEALSKAEELGKICEDIRNM
ncbi:unnamed protein product [Owenia fusiformis]|uniref:Uncharacterized protein n=1 Tax=Owenia fusiformis TaxID=6347 RepID=A0A8J1Y568_OWEFU|nr:unnamed protein product [Owenia fusiformis]